MQPGDKLGHFEIRKKLGAGGMGEVYLAQDTRLGRPVAIKTLAADLASDPGRRARFEREARAASALSHPNIAHIYDVGEQDGTPYMAMELVEGPDLSERLAASSLRQEEILVIAGQVAGALEEARGKGIIHRDIKPANIALTARGEVKVLDFGLAKMLHPVGDEAPEQTMSISQTAEGAILGTVRYMSPEQALGRDVDTRSDLFSLGVVLYEMVAGRPPFTGVSAMETLDTIVHQPPEALARFNHEVAPELERIIFKCLAKNPDHRYQTPRELGVDLGNLARSSESGTAVPTAPRPAARGWRRLGPLVAGLVIVAAVAAYFLVPRSGAAIESLAVLPFANETGDAEMDYLCNGVTESLINTLSQFPDLRVISRQSAFSVQDQGLDPQAAGKKLGVDAVLFGRVIKRGADLTISTELVDARDGRQLWGARFNRRVSEIQSVENEITGTIARKLKVELTVQEGQVLARQAAENPEAYQLYLKGREFTTGTMREMDKAIAFFQEAIALEPTYALAWAGLAQSYIRQCYLRGSERDGTVDLARQAVYKARELDPGLAEAYTAAGMIKMYFDLDWAGAEADFRRGVELGPGSVVTVMAYGDYYLFMGQYEKGLAMHLRALELDPLSISTIHDLGFGSMALQRYEDSVFYFKKALNLNPNWTWGHIKLAKTYAHLERCADALAETAIAEDLLAGSDTPAARSWLDYTYALCGETERARDGLTDLRNRSGSEYVDPSLIAIVQLGLGDLDGAIASFEQALAERSPNLVFYKMSPDLYSEALGQDPRFQTMLDKIGF